MDWYCLSIAEYKQGSKKGIVELVVLHTPLNPVHRAPPTPNTLRWIFMETSATLGECSWKPLMSHGCLIVSNLVYSKLVPSWYEVTSSTKLLLNTQCLPRLVHTWYQAGSKLVPTSTNVVPSWTCYSNLIGTWDQLGTQLVTSSYQLGTNWVPGWYQCGSNLI